MLFPSFYTLFILFIAVSTAIPVQHHFHINEELTSHYTAIVDRITESTIHEIIETAPETFLTIHQLQFTGKDYCRTSLILFIDTLEQRLNQIKTELIFAVQPSLQAINEPKHSLELNSRLSHQLGLVLNPIETAHQIINQVYAQHNPPMNIVWKIIRLFIDQHWAQTLQHEANESLALQAWLCSWLSDIEFSLKDEFDTNLYISQ
ncbi:uncharacterized protein B0P05DRAFT_575633 [Gilbertella persicaria]|uniref:Uncharacterized protein n=1 Tax=Rhizopus stolonifer TaxID=4846 RepID=A0A367JCN4_RHIST|nr:uncharacterized protein B0P05DRAFT_575633 [Gilbertella persicaria]KAI8051922.1 hypothetical protein B0P05DRAFT_575633 [Gilbertella persicaria]RCH87687.1 hypothetical protein CU098_005652 [Rhizopus stolonifer]